MKINWLAIVIVIAFVILMIYNINSCKDNGEKIGRLKGIIEERDIELSENSKAYEAGKKLHEEKIDELNANIDSANTVIAKLEEKDVDKSDKIKELEANYKTIETEAGKICNLEEQVEIWKARFSICQEKIVEKDKIIFSLQDKYNNEINLRLECEKLLNDLLEAQALKDELISELERKIRHRQRASILERGVGIAVIAALAYAALSK